MNDYRKWYIYIYITKNEIVPHYVRWKFTSSSICFFISLVNLLTSCGMLKEKKQSHLENNYSNFCPFRLNQVGLGNKLPVWNDPSINFDFQENVQASSSALRRCNFYSGKKWKLIISNVPYFLIVRSLRILKSSQSALSILKKSLEMSSR